MAWQRAGRKQHVESGSRLMAVRLEVRGGCRWKQYARNDGNVSHQLLRWRWHTIMTVQDHRVLGTC